MILKSCSSLVSVKSNTTLATESTQCSSMALALSNEEQTIPPPELLGSVEEDGHKLDTCKQKLLTAPLSQKRRKRDKNTSLVDSDLNEDLLDMPSDEVTKTAISGDTIATESTPYSVNMIECTPETYLPRKSKSTSPANLKKLKTLVRDDTSLRKEPCSDSDITQQSLVSDATANNSAPFVVQETSNKHSDIKNTVSSGDQVFKNKNLTEAGAAGPSQTRNNDKNPMKSKSDCGSGKRFKMSVSELMDLEWRSSSDRNKVDADKVQRAPQDPSTGISPTPSPKPAVSQELDHQSPIQYLSLETYSSDVQLSRSPW